MKIVKTIGDSSLAEVYIAQFRDSDKYQVEFVDSIDPRYPRSAKSCINISTQFGCPVKCIMCDAGWEYRGNLSVDEMLSQINYVINKRKDDGILSCPKLKIHFARMGEPALNEHVLTVLNKLPVLYNAPGLIPCIATVAPKNNGAWFERLLKVKEEKYTKGNFQLQFSINSTDEIVRDRIIPYPKWSLKEIADYGEKFYVMGRKVVLNFALAKGIPVDATIIRELFSPSKFAVKITPVNPTKTSLKNDLQTVVAFDMQDAANDLAAGFQGVGFDTIISIGDDRENQIGSNCGQAVTSLRNNS